MTDKKEAPRYLYEFQDSGGKMRYVDARNQQQAIAHVFRPQIRALSARDALTIARNPNIVIEIAGERPENHELPLVTAQGGETENASSEPVIDPMLEGVPTQAQTEIVDQAITQADPEPTTDKPKRGLFGRSAA